VLSSEPATIASSPGTQLAATLHHPAAPSDTTVVVAHGMLSSKESPKHHAICEAAARAGHMALRFDFRGRGASSGDPEDLTVSNEITDLAAVVEWLRRRGSRRIILVGSSLGGSVALLGAAGDPAFAALVTVAAPAHLPTAARATWAGACSVTADGRTEVAPGVFVRNRFFDDAERHDPVGAAARIHCPWLVIHGAADPVVPATDAKDFATAQPSARLAIHPTAEHRFEPPHRDWLVQRVVSFLTEHLGP